jgi:hypothetical protein
MLIKRLFMGLVWSVVFTVNLAPASIMKAGPMSEYLSGRHSSVGQSS